MPLQNRVAPDGDLHAIAARGTMMGNRGGRLHDPATRTLVTSSWRSRRWIACRLCFKKRQRDVMGNGYTELFFLDEVTALADGHRPCFECRRADARAFQQAWKAARNIATPPRADDMDLELHRERRDGHVKRSHKAKLDDLPVGAILRFSGDLLALHPSGLKVWSFAGYLPACGDHAKAHHTLVDVLTPPAILACFSAGYRPCWHPSAATT